MSRLNKHVKHDKIKWIATAFALLLIATVVVGMGLQLFGHGKTKPSEWFQKPDKQIEQIVDNVANNTDENTDNTTDNADTVTEATTE